MKRKNALFSALAVAVGLVIVPAVADETYIPRGHAYGPGSETLPPLNSQQDRVNAMADAREVEIQRWQREERMFQEQFQMMIDLHEFRPGRPYSPY